MPSEPTQVASVAPKTFEFTKRKRWADLVVTELADGIHVILSATCKILYCGPAITDILGWKSADLIDCDFLELLESPDDRTNFRTTFDASMHHKSRLLTFIRVNCSDKLPSYPFTPKNMVFEVQGEPCLSDTDDDVFFINMKPFPSRNADLLSTYVSIQMANSRSEQRHTELGQRLPQKALASPLTIAPIQIYATSPINPTSNTGSQTGNTFDNGHCSVASAPLSSSSSSNEEETDDNARRKKLKKINTGEHYVCITCGRTDSPEWRKGPLGPKTLCNACGLRWAKQTRTGKSDSDTAGENAQYDHLPDM